MHWAAQMRGTVLRELMALPVWHETAGAAPLGGRQRRAAAGALATKIRRTSGVSRSAVEPPNAQRPRDQGQHAIVVCEGFNTNGSNCRANIAVDNRTRPLLLAKLDFIPAVSVLYR